MTTVLHSLFATLIYEHQGTIDETFLVQNEIKDKLSIITATDNFENPEGWDDGVQTNIKNRFNSIDFYEINNLKKFIEHHVRNYIKIIKASEHKEVFLSHSWINFTANGQFQDWHQHQDSVISGVYYYQTSGCDGDLVFETPNPYVSLELFPIGDVVHKYIAFKPAVGKIVIFPGWLKHKVEKNKDQIPRISFSFNYLYNNEKTGQRGYR